jgi:hypothetical protein
MVSHPPVITRSIGSLVSGLSSPQSFEFPETHEAQSPGRTIGSIFLGFLQSNRIFEGKKSQFFAKFIFFELKKKKFGILTIRKERVCGEFSNGS